MLDDFNRYSCQMKLPGFGSSGQARLQAAKVLVIGMGGLGCPAALYLASSGIGTLALADDDRVSVSNLHRQILFTGEDAGMKKVSVAAAKLRQQNPHIAVVEYDLKVDAANIWEVMEPYDIVVDATDNFETRYLINDAGVLTGKPVVYGAIYQFEGQVAVWNVLQSDGRFSPHYRDVFPQVNAAMVPDCSVGGVTPPIAGMIGCMQANEVIKYLTGTGELLAGKILTLDAATLQSRVIRIGFVSKVPVTALAQPVEVPTISAAALQAALSGGVYELIDVRTPAERAEFHIGGTHVPVTELESNTNYLNLSRPTVFYCASGKRSAEAVKQLGRKFPGAVMYSLDGGLKAWQEMGQP